MHLKYVFLFAVALLPLTPLSASAQERQWNYDQTDTDAFLVFGVPGADDIGMSFWCSLNSDKIKIYYPLRNMKLAANKKAKLQLQTDTKAYDRDGKTIAEKNSAAVGVEVELSVSDDLFKDLQESSKLEITYKDSHTIFPIGNADIAGMIPLCSKSTNSK